MEAFAVTAEAMLQKTLSQAQLIGKAFSAVPDAVSPLKALNAAYKVIPARWILAAHCLFVSTLGSDFKDKFLVHFWVSLIKGSNFCWPRSTRAAARGCGVHTLLWRFFLSIL